jgi:hypothetical protein
VEDLGEWLDRDDPTTAIHVHNGEAQWAVTGRRARERGQKSGAVRTPEDSYPFDRFTEIKADRVPFKSIVRGENGALSVRTSPQLAGAWVPLLHGFNRRQQQPAPSLQSLARLPLPVPAPVSTSPRVDRSAPVLSPPPEETLSRPLVAPGGGAEGPADLTEEQKAEPDRLLKRQRDPIQATGGQAGGWAEGERGTRPRVEQEGPGAAVREVEVPAEGSDFFKDLMTMVRREKRAGDEALERIRGLMII